MLTFLRRAALASAVALASVSSAFAQGHAFGAKAGFDLATQRVTPTDSTADRRWLVSVVAGGFYTQPLVSRLDLQIEGLYAARGARLTIAGLTETIRIEYLEVPVVVRAHFGRYYAEAGASAAVRLRARATIPFAGSTESVDIANEVERTDYGVAGGAGAEFGRLAFDVRYTHGIKDVDRDRADASRTRNRAIAITVGARF